MYDRILVPTDGSTGTAHVAIEAFGLADRYGASVHLLHVIESTVGNVLARDTDAKAEQREFGRQVIRPLEEMADVYGLEATTELRLGDPSEEILACAGEVDADVIVMGTHGATRRNAVGSTASRVLRETTLPVLTV